MCTPTPEVAGEPNVTVLLPHLVGGEGILDALQRRQDSRHRFIGAPRRAATRGQIPVGSLFPLTNCGADLNYVCVDLILELTRMKN